MVHTTASTAVFGLTFLYFNKKHQQNGQFFVPLLTNMLDKTSAAASAILRAILVHLISLPEFKAVWTSITKVFVFMDVGPHFKSKPFLYYLLIEFVKTYGKHTIAQFFPGGMARPDQWMVFALEKVVLGVP
jgi:hypothetical protein